LPRLEITSGYALGYSTLVMLQGEVPDS